MSKQIQVMIAGAQKAGTSSLKFYLGQHPEIRTHERNEIAFFIHDQEYKLGYETIYPRYFRDDSADHALVLAKNAAIMYIPRAARRLWDHNPNVYVIASIRNPVDRAYSAYWYARRKGWENIELFEDALAAESARLKEDRIKWRQCAYIDRGMYHDQIVRLWEQFGKQQVKVLLLEDVQKDPVGLCKSLFQEWGLDAGFTPLVRERINRAATVRSDLLARLIASSNAVKQGLSRIIPAGLRYYMKERIKKVNEREFSPPPIDPRVRKRLTEYFEPYNRELSKILGRDLSHWGRS